MFKPFFLYVGYKYARSKRDNHFISFISLTSMLGIALGVAVLITVLSVMNGFNKEIRAKMLTFTPHIVLRGLDGPLQNWSSLAEQIKVDSRVKTVAPYIASQGLLIESGSAQPVIIHGIDPTIPNEAYPLTNVVSGDAASLNSGEFGVILGRSLAQNLGLVVGDKVTFLIPEASATIAGVKPKFKRLNVVSIYDTGTHYDDRNAFLNITDAARMFKYYDSVSGIQMQVRDEMQAVRIAQELNKQLQYKYWLVDWTTEHANFFEALNMEKVVMWCILCLIIAVAAFNLVSSLVMMVTDKRSDIAILRTMGATPRSVMGIFVSQGLIIGVIGTLLGLVFGLLLAYNVTAIAEYIQNLLNVQFVSEDVYLVSFVPSQIRQSDVVLVCSFSVIMSLLATIYPAWRAATVAPAEALRYE